MSRTVLDRLDALTPRALARRPEIVLLLAAALFLAGTVVLGQRAGAPTVDVDELAGRDPGARVTATAELTEPMRLADVDALAVELGVTVSAIELALRDEQGRLAPAGVLDEPRRIGWGGRQPFSGAVDALAEMAAEALQKADELDALASSTDDEDFAALYAQDRDLLRGLAAAAQGGDCACVVAVAVRGSAGAVAALATNPAVARLR